MNINWFTVVAQLINFLVLVWLLKKFLYKPVLDAIDAREQKIISRLEDATAKEDDAKKAKDEFAEKNKQFDAQKKDLMAKAIAETQVQKDKLLQNAREAVDALQVKQKKSMIEMQESLEKDLAQKTRQHVFDISRKTLIDLASTTLETQAAKLFLSRIAGLNAEEKQQFKTAFSSGNGPVTIQSAFELPENSKNEIENAVNETLGNKTEIEFRTAPEVISGIELTANGYKLDWSISAYLNALQNSITETLESKEAETETI